MRFTGTRPIHGDIRQRRVFLWWPKTQWSDSGTGHVTRWLEWAEIQETYLDRRGYVPRQRWSFDHFADQTSCATPDPYKPVAINLLLRGSLFALVGFAAHRSGIDWGAFGVSGFWALAIFTYPNRLDYTR